MGNEETENKKLTLQGSSKLKLGLDLNSLVSSNTGAMIVKKRRKKFHEEHDAFDSNKLLGSLTEKEQIFRINAVQNAALLKEKNNKQIEKEIIVEVEVEENENDNDNKDEQTDSDTEVLKVEEQILEDIDKKEDDQDSKKKSSKASKDKDTYSKHTKLIIEQAIDEKVEQAPIFRQKFGIRNKKLKFAKGKNISREVTIPDEITVKELSIRMAENSKNVLRILKEEVGESYRANDLVDSDIACEIAKKFNHTVKRVSDADKEKDLFSIENLPKKHKPPIVTFMGHVDHGKTSLLDAFRESNVVERESGGITQHIGAYQIVTQNKQKITFIDTPGHEAFTAMRACGANITNIVVIVVAADDGIMKQTVEAINHAKAANVSIIVAINKIDKSQPGDVEKVISSLPQYNLIPEELGGDVMVVPVSAKKKINLDKLEEAILLIAELMSLEAIVDCRAMGWVVESKIDKAKGISATLIVEEGTLKVGDMLVIGTIYGKVRSMINHLGQREKAALPSTPIEITSLNGIPSAGDKFVVVSSEKQAREVVEYRSELAKKKKESLDSSDLDIFSHGSNKTEELCIILKCDVTGSIEAISSSIDKLGKDEVKLNILHKAVGSITDSDVLLAEASNAVILAFNVKVDSKIRDLAKQKGIEIHTYNIIYELIDDMRMYLTKMLKPIIRENHIGSASVRQIFNVSKASNIIGCHVSNGIIKRDSLIKVMRNNTLIYTGKLKALRRFKDDVKEVSTNFECGMSLEGNVDVKVGDILEAYQIVQEERVL